MNCLLIKWTVKRICGVASTTESPKNFNNCAKKFLKIKTVLQHPSPKRTRSSCLVREKNQHQNSGETVPLLELLVCPCLLVRGHGALLVVAAIAHGVSGVGVVARIHAVPVVLGRLYIHSPPSLFFFILMNNVNKKNSDTLQIRKIVLSIYLLYFGNCLINILSKYRQIFMIFYYIFEGNM